MQGKVESVREHTEAATATGLFGAVIRAVAGVEYFDWLRIAVFEELAARNDACSRIVLSICIFNAIFLAYIQHRARDTARDIAKVELKVCALQKDVNILKSERQKALAALALVKLAVDRSNSETLTLAGAKRTLALVRAIAAAGTATDNAAMAEAFRLLEDAAAMPADDADADGNTVAETIVTETTGSIGVPSSPRPSDDRSCGSSTEDSLPTTLILTTGHILEDEECDESLLLDTPNICTDVVTGSTAPPATKVNEGGNEYEQGGDDFTTELVEYQDDELDISAESFNDTTASEISNETAVTTATCSPAKEMM
mmetsp:Transcript_36665/g.74741  ORF Transcript_36665/g.74741 Transcript_36665/m.74741 type:complete len:314 (-) Transcript_36665:189-1130(-)|eukprot:CAMPEP_0178706272 /NCGR_PEP_ID=MMETSP0699-20121125/15306_1 /TAXON_ID=265572 /ORGANISM="Extubocellulus spinifer, Strain CCMP396" /LENGTH=313 /DNA_ID=CAMNT_0020354037 /DNA_START=239 /DNA_END=1183 /DNA_ORIENTATION=-